MKKVKLFICVLCIAALLTAGSGTSLAYDMNREIPTELFLAGDRLVLTEETKISDLTFNDTIISFTGRDGNALDGNAQLKTGDMLWYFGVIDYRVILLGDVNRDGFITASDARAVLRYASQLDRLSAEDNDCAAACDADLSGVLTVEDARLILRCAAGLEDFGGIKEEYLRKQANKPESDYSPSEAIIMLNPACVDNEACYTSQFYGEDKVKDVEILMDYRETGEVYLLLTLCEPSRKNVDRMIEELKDNDAVIAAERNVIINLY